MEPHRHCDQCGRVKPLGLEPCCELSVGEQALAAMRREQDQDWAHWSSKQREKARQNGEYYGEERLEEQSTH